MDHPRRGATLRRSASTSGAPRCSACSSDADAVGAGHACGCRRRLGIDGVVGTAADGRRRGSAPSAGLAPADLAGVGARRPRSRRPAHRRGVRTRSTSASPSTAWALAPLLADQLGGVPVTVENDLNVAAVGAARGARSGRRPGLPGPGHRRRCRAPARRAGAPRVAVVGRARSGTSRYDTAGPLVPVRPARLPRALRLRARRSTPRWPSRNGRPAAASVCRRRRGGRRRRASSSGTPSPTPSPRPSGCSCSPATSSTWCSAAAWRRSGRPLLELVAQQLRPAGRRARRSCAACGSATGCRSSPTASRWHRSAPRCSRTGSRPTASGQRCRRRGDAVEVVILGGPEEVARARRRPPSTAAASGASPTPCWGWRPAPRPIGHLRRAGPPRRRRVSSTFVRRLGRSRSTSTSACRPAIRRATAAVLERAVASSVASRRGAVQVPDGGAADLEAAAADYERAIAAAGGIDLQLLGIGANGHIGFNEPTSSLRLAHPHQDPRPAHPRGQRAVLRLAVGRAARTASPRGSGPSSRPAHCVLARAGRGQGRGRRGRGRGAAGRGLPGVGAAAAPAGRSCWSTRRRPPGSGLPDYYRWTYAHKPAWQRP